MSANQVFPGDATESCAEGEPAEPLPTVHLPETGHGLALTILATIAVIYALDWAQHFVISLLLGILFAYTLNPLVTWLEGLRIPRGAGSTLVMLSVVGALALGSYSLRGQIQTIVDQLPDAASKLTAQLSKLREGQPSTLQKVQTVATQIEKATNSAADTAVAPLPSETRVVIAPPAFKLGNFLWAGSMGAAGLIAQAATVLFLTFFLLLAGDTYKRKLVRLAGPTMSKRKITVRILDDINASIQRYMFMLLSTNVLVALLSWAALRWIGLENAGAWAVAAGLLHVIPYFGPAVTAAAFATAGLIQSNSLPTALLLASVALAIATFVGTFVATWMTGRTAKINVTALFVSLLFWAWLWGIWGMLLSIPITVIVKVLAEHIEQLEPIAELLAE
jgi:predicted PurR-regulated permease PerM